MAIYEFPHTRNYEDDTTKLLMDLVTRLDTLNENLIGLTERIDDLDERVQALEEEAGV